jgi:ribonuclease PH
VGRALRCAMDLPGMPECTLWVDCDVISADGGTRTTAINGSLVALYDALLWMEEKRLLKKWPLRGMLSAVSVGLVKEVPMIDLDYVEDSTADVDMNVVCSADGRLIEVQSTAEQRPIAFEQFQAMLDLARIGCTQVLELQKKVLGI